MLSQLKWALRTQIRRQLTLWKTNPLQALQKQRRGRRHLRFCRETNPQQLHPGKSSYIPADTTELIVSTVNLLVQNCHQDHSTSKGCARHAVMIASAISIPFLTITSIGKTSTRKCVMLASLPTARRRFQEIAIAGNTSSRRTAVFLLRGKWWSVRVDFHCIFPTYHNECCAYPDVCFPVVLQRRLLPFTLRRQIRMECWDVYSLFLYSSRLGWIVAIFAPSTFTATDCVELLGYLFPFPSLQLTGLDC